MPKRTALLIGNQSFMPESGLEALRGPHNDIARLSQILGDEKRGSFTVKEFVDQASYEVLPEVEETLGGARSGDLVLIYYSGHGKLDRYGHVCLAAANTREVALLTTSIPALTLTDLVERSDCDQVVLLLDCCYSGAVTGLRGASVNSEMHAIENATGFYILTASTGLQTAREDAFGSDGTVMGRFTAALVDGIERGTADTQRKGQIVLSDLRYHLGKVVTGQTPQFFAKRAVGDPVISLSPETAAPQKPQEQATSADSDFSGHLRIERFRLVRDISDRLEFVRTNFDRYRAGLPHDLHIVAGETRQLTNLHQIIEQNRALLGEDFYQILRRKYEMSVNFWTPDLNTAEAYFHWDKASVEVQDLLRRMLPG